jgi:ADP-ribose pyrophosphatase
MKEFERLNTRSVYEGRAFGVDVVETRLPDGKVRNFDLVRHPGAVTLLPVDEQGNILFVRQYRLGAEQNLLELPAGTLEPGENPDASAAREIREETGMGAREIRKLGTFYMAPGYSTEHMHVYLATGLFPDWLEGDEDEFLQVDAVPIARAYEMARSGELVDGKSLAALLMAEPFLLKSF